MLDKLNNTKVNVGGGSGKGGQSSSKQQMDDAQKLADFIIRQQGQVDKAITDAYNKRLKLQQQNTATDMKAEEEAAKNKAKIATDGMAAQFNADKQSQAREIALRKETEAQKVAALRTSQRDEANLMRDQAAQADTLHKQEGERIAATVKAEQAAYQQRQASLAQFAQRAQTVLNAPRVALEALSKTLGNVAQGMEHAGQVFSIFGYRVALVTAPLIALGGAGAKASIELENSVRLAATQLDDLSADNVTKFTATVSAQIRQLSTEIPQAADDMAKSMYFLVSTLSIKPEVAESFVKPIAEFATAIDSNSLLVTKAIVPILNVYKEYAKDATGLGKSLEIVFEAIRRGSGEPSDLINQLGTFLEAGKLANATLPESLAIYSQLSRISPPAQAATQESQLFRALTDPDTIAALKAVNIETETVVEGTGQWVKETEALDKKQSSTYKSIVNKLQGAEGVTGLYLDLEKAQERVSVATEKYQAKATTANTSALKQAQLNLDVKTSQIAILEAQKAGLTGRTGLVFTGETVKRSPLAIIAETKEYLDAIKDVNDRAEAAKGLFPEVRGERGALGLFEGLGDVQKWAASMEDGTNRVKSAFEIMRGSIQNELKLLQSSVLAATGQIFDEQIAPKLRPLLETINKFIASFQTASPAFKEFAVTFTLIGAAIGPLSLVLGTVLLGLGEMVSIIATLVSPVGLVLLVALVTVLGPLFRAIASGVDAAGGGMQGFARLAAEVAVQLGIIQQTDAVKFLSDLGVKSDDIGQSFGGLHDKAADLIKQLQELATNVKKIVDAISEVVSFISSHEEVLKGAVFTLMAAEVLKAVIALVGAGGLVGALGEAGAAVAGFSALPLIAAALLGTALVLPILVQLTANEQEFRAQMDKIAPGFFGSANLAGGETANTAIGVGRPNAPDTNLPLPSADEVAASGEEYRRRRAAAFAANSQNNTPTFVDQSLDAAWAQANIPTWMQDEIQGNVAGRPKTTKPTASPTGLGAGGAGSGLGIPARNTPGFTNPPSGMDVLDKLGGKAWTGAFAQEHNGQDPYSFYAGQGYQDPAAAALRDKSWGDSFAQAHGGKGPEKSDWENHWYESYKKTEVDELDAAGKPTGKKKTAISGPVDEFTKAVAEAFKGLTDKKDDLKATYVDPAQALIDKKPDIIEAYIAGPKALKEIVVTVIETIDALRAKVAASQKKASEGDTPPADATTSSTGGTRGYDIGGNVKQSGIYRLLKGEHILTVPDQIALGRNMSSVSNSYAGDSHTININGANANPREIADEVVSRLRIEKARRGPSARAAY